MRLGTKRSGLSRTHEERESDTVLVMTTQSATPQLGHIDDDELDRLAIEWRKRALRGDRESYGIAHALEVEQRRRLRPSQLVPLPSIKAVRRPWWRPWSGRAVSTGHAIRRT